MLKRLLDFKTRQSCLLQKGTSEFHKMVDVETVEFDICCDTVEMVGNADNFHLTGVVDSVAVSSDTVGVDVPVLQPGRAQLWDVASGMRASRLPVPPTSDMTLAWTRWNTELEGDINREYLLDGVMNSFLIVDRECDLNNISRRNYNSVYTLNQDYAEKQILKEIKLGRYIVTDIQPRVVSSLGAVPKGLDKVRIIHDLSRPEGGVNDFGVHSSVHYSTLDDAIAQIGPNSYLAKIDLSEAYRSVPIHPYCYELTGIHWIFAGQSQKTFMFDSRLPFGSSLPCFVFQSLSDAIVRICVKKGLKLISYLDDFLLIADTQQRCKESLDYLVELVYGLGFGVNWDKVEQPSQQQTFLGVKIDCVKITLSLPDKKLAEVKLLLVSWLKKSKVTKRGLQQIIGKLSWCARVIRGGRTFVRNLINLLPRVKQAHHFVRLNAAGKSDLKWWSTGLEFFNGKSPFPIDLPIAKYTFATDACLIGGAAYFELDWFYVNWYLDYPEYAESNINVLELLTVLESARRWGSKWAGHHILVRSDNVSAVAAINNSTSRSGPLLEIIKELFWLAVKFDFKLSACHLSGKLNVLSDKLSRLHCFDDAVCAKNMLVGVNGVITCVNHISYTSYLFLQGMWSQRWQL
jgi:hypothetical protein